MKMKTKMAGLALTVALSFGATLSASAAVDPSAYSAGYFYTETHSSGTYLHAYAYGGTSAYLGTTGQVIVKGRVHDSVTMAPLGLCSVWSNSTPDRQDAHCDVTVGTGTALSGHYLLSPEEQTYYTSSTKSDILYGTPVNWN